MSPGFGPRTLAAVALAATLGAPAGRDEASLATLDVAELRAVRANAGGKLRLISVWASVCGPCVVELPDIARLARAFPRSRFEVVTLSTDEADRHESAVALLRRHQVLATNYRFVGALPALATTLDPAWDGALPFALLLAPGGDVLATSRGALEADLLERAIRKWLAGADSQRSSRDRSSDVDSAPRRSCRG